jgi:hypothetical protein
MLVRHAPGTTKNTKVLLFVFFVVSAAPTRGPHDATADHPFDNVTHWVAVFDNPARDGWQQPQKLVRALGLQPGMTVADLGAGTGYFSRYLSAAVGPAGTVLAVDTEPNLVRHLRDRAEKEDTPNVSSSSTPSITSTIDLAISRAYGRRCGQEDGWPSSTGTSATCRKVLRWSTSSHASRSSRKCRW